MLRHLRLHRQYLHARGWHSSEYFRLSREVDEAVRAKRPVIALESTILTHGLPAKKALQLTKELEQMVITAGVVPATIGILDGKLIVGMSQLEQTALISEAERNLAGKAALKDLPLILSGATKHRSFGTTVSATLFAAHKANIPIFATGGIGGVHRGAESTFDISSDLVALSQFPMAVVSAGVKSILDIPKTLELLETLSVTVATHASDEFPAFFTSKSGVKSPGRVDSPAEAAKILKIIKSQLKTKQGFLVAVPNLSTSDLIGQEIEQAIQTAISEVIECTDSVCLHCHMQTLNL
ncbi:hypothetical protein Ciccas_004196 [Cichlidogyrus casuarinus]|uniref:Pseudouridine-5'-phosphate glycosidase n=1 Tax=Cichlidogyrus casuarinus TaxID=1844966 RepID=A0ABD2QCA6_9PLAT